MSVFPLELKVFSQSLPITAEHCGRSRRIAHLYSTPLHLITLRMISPIPYHSPHHTPCHTTPHTTPRHTTPHHTTIICHIFSYHILYHTMSVAYTSYRHLTLASRQLIRHFTFDTNTVDHIEYHTTYCFVFGFFYEYFESGAVSFWFGDKC